MAAFKLPSLPLKKRRRQLTLPEFTWNAISIKEEQFIWLTVWDGMCGDNET